MKATGSGLVRPKVITQPVGYMSESFVLQQTFPMPLPMMEDEDILILVSMVEHIRDLSYKDRSDVLSALSKKMQECVSLAKLLETYLDLPNFYHRIPDIDVVRPTLAHGQITIIAAKVQYQAHDEWNQLAAVAFSMTSKSSSKIRAGMVFVPAYDPKKKPDPREIDIEEALSLICDLRSESQKCRAEAMERLCCRKYDTVEICGCWIGIGQSRVLDNSEEENFCSVESNSSILDEFWASSSLTESTCGEGLTTCNLHEDDFIMVNSTNLPGNDAEDRHLLMLADEEEEARLTKRKEEVIPAEKGLLPVMISKVKGLIPGSYHGARLGFVFGCLAAYVDDEKLPSEKVEEVILQTVSGAVGGSVGRYAGALFAVPAAAGEMEARRALLKAGSLASAAVVAVSALYDGLQYARGRETRIDFRRNFAANTFGAAGSLMAGAAVAAATAGGGAVGWPAAAVALGASVAGVAGGICGSYAGRVADAASFDAEADAAVHAYEFFGWPAPPRHGPRPVKSAAEVAAAYRRRVAERPGAARWAGRCTENLLKLLRAMHPE